MTLPHQKLPIYAAHDLSMINESLSLVIVLVAAPEFTLSHDSSGSIPAPGTCSPTLARWTPSNPMTSTTDGMTYPYGW